MIISATQKSLLALLFLFCSQLLHAQSISCFDAQVLKDKSTQNIPSVSDYSLPNSGLIGCFSDTLHQTYWFKFTAITSGTFKFAASSNNLAADYDFVLFSEACPCDTLASKVMACNWIGAVLAPPFVPTGIGNPVTDFGISDPMAQLEFDQTVTLTAGKNYYLILDNISNNSVGFKIEFGGTAQIGAPLPSLSPTLGNLVGKTEICAGLSSIYEVQTDPRFTNYTWKAPAGAKIIGSGNKVKIDFAQAGGKVQVIAQNSCVSDTAFLNVNVNLSPDLTLTDDAYFCKNTCLDTKNIKYKEKNNIQNTVFQYYTKKDDAFLGTLKNLTTPAICQPQTIYLRATSDKNCFDTLNIDVALLENPSSVLIGGGVVCYGDTATLSFSFTGKAPYDVTYTDGVQNWNFSTNKEIITKEIVISQPSKIVVTDFKESSNLCVSRIIGSADFFPSINCKCLKKAGTMNSLPLDACANLPIKAIHNKDETKDASDKLVFILHSVQSPDLATIFATNTTPEFSFSSGLMTDITYYIAAVVGKKKANGDIDFTDPCLGVSAGVPIVFHKAPSAKLEGDTLICNNDITDISLTPSGMPPFEVTYGNSTFNNVLNIDKKLIFKESTGTFYVKEIKDAMGCTAVFSDTIRIKTPAKIEAESKNFVCNAANTSYQIVLNTSGGDVATLQSIGLKGTFQKGIFTSENISNGQSFNLKITDKKACDTLFVADKHTCSCGAQSQPATLNPFPIVICESFAATASYNQDEKLVLGEVQGYILHDGDATKIGKVLTYNTFPQFSKKVGMQNAKTYYITSVAGSKDGTGKVDLQSPCTQFGKLSVAITFVEEPTAMMSGASEICKGETADINFTFTGTPLFDILYNDGKKDVAILNINTLQHPVMFAAPDSTTFKLISVKTSGSPGCKGQVIAGKNEVAVDVLPALIAQNQKVECSADKKNFQVSFDINGGKSGTYTINSSPISGSSFVSTSLKDGETYNFKIENTSTNCKPIFVTGVGYCSCPPNAFLGIKTIAPIKCNGDKNAILEADVKNIKAPLTYIWSNGATNATIKNLDASTYKVTVSNDENCTLIDSIVLKNPSPIRTFVEVQDVRCFGEASGNITFNMTDGGTAPYLYSIDNQTFVKENIFSKLKSNRYDLVVKDANNCIWENVKDLNQPEESYVRLGDDQIINLGQSTQIQAIVSADYEEIKWSDAKLSGTNLSITPLKSIEYKVTITDKNGCEAKDAVWIYVKSEREVYAPTNFSPNNDGYNDAFTIFAGVDVSKIKELQVFDRWGNQVFGAIDISPNDEAQGWQGTFRGQIANQDLYIYKVVVEFIDGKSKNFSGEVSLLR